MYTVQNVIFRNVQRYHSRLEDGLLYYCLPPEYNTGGEKTRRSVESLLKSDRGKETKQKVKDDKDKGGRIEDSAMGV